MTRIKTAALVTVPATLAAALLFGAAVLLMPTPAWPHKAMPTAAQPEGWNYSIACCSGTDCRAVNSPRSGSRVTIAETPQGYRISTTGETIAYNDRRIKESPDGEFHWCSVGGSDDSRTLCLYAPPRSY